MIEARELTIEEGLELVESLSQAKRTILGAANELDREATIELLAERVDVERENSGEDPQEIGFLGGLILGDALVQEKSWRWKNITYDNGFESVGVVSPDDSYLCLVFHYVYELMRSKQRDNTLPLLWQTVVHKGLPPASSKAYLLLD